VLEYEKEKANCEKNTKHIKSKSGDFVLERNVTKSSLDNTNNFYQSHISCCHKQHSKISNFNFIAKQSPNKKYFNNYLKPFGEFFDPTCSYGGIDTVDSSYKIRHNSKNRSNSKSKLDEPKDYKFREYTGSWNSTKDYFMKNEDVTNKIDNPDLSKKESIRSNESTKTPKTTKNTSLISNLRKINFNITNKKKIVGAKRYI